MPGRSQTPRRKGDFLQTIYILILSKSNILLLRNSLSFGSFSRWHCRAKKTHTRSSFTRARLENERAAGELEGTRHPSSGGASSSNALSGATPHMGRANSPTQGNVAGTRYLGSNPTASAATNRTVRAHCPIRLFIRVFVRLCVYVCVCTSCACVTWIMCS